ncbi:hypothetical protein [Amycolatopsis albispora]|uniref:PE domain-containing protein n=1 Tax=Amycolatopsis albispora TaxID=1804986 RepID=A0A344LBY3_9PSEU|nr:hypothetical protein [Amycolatopsis albispora]AXB45557.1 hypothetical protein A4R43_26230 [Amycolatopsis albispora]
MSTWQQPADVGKWLNEVPWVITDSPQGAAGPPSGGFAMSRSEMINVLTEAKQLRVLVDKQIMGTQPLSRITPPGRDPASERYVAAANATGFNYLNHLRLQSKYLGDLIGKLNKALGNVEETDANAAAAARKAGEH